MNAREPSGIGTKTGLGPVTMMAQGNGSGDATQWGRTHKIYGSRRKFWRHLASVPERALSQAQVRREEGSLHRAGGAKAEIVAPSGIGAVAGPSIGRLCKRED